MDDASRIPVATTADLDALDGDEILEGYRDGHDGEPCGGNRSRSYWHGWRNGRADAGLDAPDTAARSLAREVHARSGIEGTDGDATTRAGDPAAPQGGRKVQEGRPGRRSQPSTRNFAAPVRSGFRRPGCRR